MAEARILYVATADGLYQLANPGKSDRWREVGRALEGQDIRSVAASPNDPLRIFATSSLGIFRSTNGGMSWEQVYTDSVRQLAFAPEGAIYAATEPGTMLYSIDGMTWDEIQVAEAPVKGFVASADDLIVAFDDNAVYEWTPSGWKWQAKFTPEVRVIGLTAVASSDGSGVFVVAEVIDAQQAFPAPPTGALVMLSGKNKVLLIGTYGPLLRGEYYDATLSDAPNLSSERLGILFFGSSNGDKPLTVVAGPQHVTADGTALRIFNDMPLAVVAGPQYVTALVTLPRYIDQVFASTGDGALWFSDDRGRNWVELRAGYPPVRDIAFTRAL